MSKDSDIANFFSRRSFFKLSSAGVLLSGCNPFTPKEPPQAAATFIPPELSQELSRIYNRYEFSNNENPIGSSPSLSKLSIKATDLNRYELLYSYHDLFLKNYASLLSTSKDFIKLGPGSTELLKRTLKAEKLKNNKLAISIYEWPKYVRLSKEYGLIPSLTDYADYHHDLEALSIAARKSSIVYLTNPNVPYGRRQSKEKLLNFIKSVSSKTLIVIDECYLQFSGSDWEKNSLAPYTKEFPNLIISQTFSKFYGLGSARIGALICNPKTYENFGIREPEVLDVSIYPVMAANISLTDTEHHTQTRTYVSEVMDYYEEFFKKNNCSFIRGETNYGVLQLNKGSSLIRKYLVESLGYKNYPRMTPPYLLVSAARKENIDKYLKGLMLGLSETGYI